jgi:hypothetical protein
MLFRKLRSSNARLMHDNSLEVVMTPEHTTVKCPGLPGTVLGVVW